MCENLSLAYLSFSPNSLTFQALVCSGNGNLEVAVNLALDFDQISSGESMSASSESAESIDAEVNLGEPKKASTKMV